MSSMPDMTLVAYVASPHAGYLKLFRKYPGAVLYVLGPEFISEFPSLTRHLPGNEPEEARVMIEALGIFREVKVLRPGMQGGLVGLITMPDEDVSHAFASKYLPDADISFDGEWRLRWDWAAVAAPQASTSDELVSEDELDQNLLGRATASSLRSPDWWRQVGALLARDGNAILTAYNTHLPSEQSNYLLGDPRSNFGPGENIDISAALHAEIGVLTEAARRGISTEGCDLYVTTFPCPPCAYAVANAGIKRLFYADGYSLIAGRDALASRGVKIIRVT